MQLVCSLKLGICSDYKLLTTNYILKNILIKKKEVIQPQVPLRLPCDDLTHLTEPRFDRANRRNLT